MKNINKIPQFIKSNRVIFILFAVYVAFHSFFEKHITILLVDTFFSYLDPAWYNDFIAIVVFVIFFIYFRNSIKRNSYISNQILVLSVILFLIIGYYRFFSDVWFFIPIFIWDKIKYIDVILVFCLLSIVLCPLNYFRRKKYSCSENQGFLFDNPIETEIEDKLNRRKTAKILAEKIKNTVSSESAFAIGICSEWGQGKTSFLNLIKNKLEEDNEKNRIIVEFNTWLNNDECSIINSFFDELSKELKPYNKELSHNLIEYAKILNTTENTFIEKLKIINHSTNLKASFDAVNDKIKKSGKQIVVFIDDLDRLYEKEIVEVLRLIRNSANFANTVFIVAYDRNYVISALKQANEYRPSFYLEKIFQFEIMLPNFEKYIIADEFKRAIEPFLTDKDKTTLRELLLRYEFGERRFSYSKLSNIRDINRFANSFLISYEILKGEVELLDLLNIELLRIKYLGVYSLLAKEYSRFLENKSNNYFDKAFSYLCLRKLKDENDDKKELEETVLEKYLKEHYINVGIQKNQIKEAISYVSIVFPSYDAFVRPNYYSSLLSIANATAIDRYFQYNLLNSNLSEIEFSTYRQKPEEEFQAQIENWVNDGLSSEIFNRLERIDLFENREDYEKIIRTIFFFASLHNKDGILSFDGDNLLSKLTDEKVKVFYKDDELKVFVKNLFDTQKPPYLFVSDFINKIFYESAFNWKLDGILSKEDLINQKLNYFKEYAETATAIDGIFFRLYHNCGYIKWVDSGNNSLSQKEEPPNKEAKIIFKQYAKKLIDSFLKGIITKKDNYYYTVPVFNILPIWDDWGSFEKFLSELDEQQNSKIKEFKEFFSKFKDADFNYVKFDFKEIDLNINKRA